MFESFSRRSHADLVVLKELQEEGGHSGGDADEEVDDNQEHIRCAGNLEPEGCWVHDGSDGPAEETRNMKVSEVNQSPHGWGSSVSQLRLRWLHNPFKGLAGTCDLFR